MQELKIERHKKISRWLMDACAEADWELPWLPLLPVTR